MFETPEKVKSSLVLKDEIIAALSVAGIPSPRLESGIILRHAAPDFPQITAAEEQKAREMTNRRVAHEPLDKIIGVREFYKSFFIVNKDVLSPRPDTEVLLESALSLIPDNEAVRILDMGTGSGCILLSLLKEKPLACGWGMDISAAALKVAAENAKLLDVAARIEFVNQSWTTADFPADYFDMIVSNPPYIPTAEIRELDPEVRDFDPLQALDGGADGYACYREIAAVAPLILKKGGYILLEGGKGQAENIAAVFKAAGLHLVEIAKDLSGINRCVILKK